MFGLVQRREEIRHPEPNVIRYRIKLTLSFIAFFSYMYLVLGRVTLNSSRIYIPNVDIQNMHVKPITDKNVPRLVGNFTHKITFGEEGMHNAYLDSAVYNISMIARGYPVVSAISTTNATVSFSAVEQPVVVRFEANQTDFPEEQLRGFQKMLEDGNVWVKIKAGFKWRLKLARFLKYPYIYKNVYFTCTGRYRASPDDEIKNVTCAI
ncbi:hypothetical protein Hanom_Chr03g00184751 [Helianthus anomalus]